MKCLLFNVKNNIQCRMLLWVAPIVSLSTDHAWKSKYNLPISYSI